MIGYSITRAIGKLPDPSDPGFATVLATLGAFVGAAVHLARNRTLGGIQLTAFMFGFVATGMGLMIYAGCVIAAGF
jgi:hypothetical protein